MNRPGSDNINRMSTISSIKLLDLAYAWYRARHMDAHASHLFWSFIPDKRVHNLLRQMMNRMHVYQGQYRLIDNKGIPRGCSLSPLLGALYLSLIDHYAKQNKIKYIRYMDDFVFFTNSKVHLRRIIKDVYEMVNQLGLRLAQAKTWVGRTTKGMDFLGYRLSHSGLSIAQSIGDLMTGKSGRLYEQGAPKLRLHAYAKKWISWAQPVIRLETLWLTLKTTVIVQHICGERLLLE